MRKGKPHGRSKKLVVAATIIIALIITVFLYFSFYANQGTSEGVICGDYYCEPTK